MRCPPEGRPPVGYIPAGTVNDFASSLGISKNMHEATATILSGEPFLCDVGAFGDRYFSYIAAFGAFTDVSYQTPQQSKNLLGRAAYFLEAILRLPAVKAYRMSVTHDGETVEGEFLFGMVTNATSVGGFKLRAGANISMNDGCSRRSFSATPKPRLRRRPSSAPCCARSTTRNSSPPSAPPASPCARRKRSPGPSTANSAAPPGRSASPTAPAPSG